MREDDDRCSPAGAGLAWGAMKMCAGVQPPDVAPLSRYATGWGSVGRGCVTGCDGGVPSYICGVRLSSVDLVQTGAVRNPFVLHQIDQEREVVFVA